RAADFARLAPGDVLRGQRAAMRLDDLAADRQPEPRILAEGLAGRPVGVEALEDAVDVVDADAGAIVVDGQHDPLADARQRNRYAAGPFGHEGTGVLDQVGDDLAKPEVGAGHEIALGAGVLRALGQLVGP